LTLQSEWIAQAKRIEDLSNAQRKLEDQAQAIASRSGKLDKRETDLKKRISKAKANIRRIQNNERFAKWLDNTVWALQAVVFKVSWWSGDIKILIAVVALSLFVITPICTILSLRLLLSDRCFQIIQCRAVAVWMADIKPKSGKH
jgi:uncharacterized membrane protein YjjP (DUF1212 family)